VGGEKPKCQVECSSSNEVSITIVFKFFDPPIIISLLFLGLSMYFARQKESNTCFIHALNNYFQKKYIDDEFFHLVPSFQPMDAKKSFFGSIEPYESNENDLHGYYVLYELMQEEFNQVILDSKCTELSPGEALYILQNQIQDGKIQRVPRRIFHRFARRDNELETIQDFHDHVVRNPKIERIFFCHIELNKSHAFAAIKKDGSWYLLDSLLDDPVKMSNLKELFENPLYALRASVMIVQDYQTNE
jgi:hypothetical protein